MNPWDDPNWLEGVQDWLGQQFPSIAPVVPSHVWVGAFCGTTTLDGNKLYFKALPPHLIREPRITAFLQAHLSSLPKVLALEPEQGWLLTQNAGETHLVHDPDPKHWCMGLRAMAELQIATLEMHSTLLGLGCVVQDSQEAIAKAKLVLGRHSQDENTPAALAVLEQISLEGLDLLPLALCHGDFHPMNVISPCTIIDWSDALIAHPFTDLERFLRWIMGNSAPHPWSPFADTRSLEPRFVRAFLEPWVDFAPLSQLEAAFWRTRPLGFAVLLAQYAEFTGQGRSLEAFYVRQLAKSVL
jgi:Phosphotransferase enzyme family